MYKLNFLRNPEKKTPYLDDLDEKHTKQPN